MFLVMSSLLQAKARRSITKIVTNLYNVLECLFDNSVVTNTTRLSFLFKILNHLLQLNSLSRCISLTIT